ncbi:hypothetical protein [Sandaracinobacteroides saxicola]|uniref:DUF1801 domain-containing protein n=1 Tax=Sandaracinobacteroides saxicola TaxID=2759707 RepID=A0A7G5IHB5_9SPHN|nr:hypothetical protein [Sandaracinobacteroides saxicola]QMW22757.1 hypothetical protein H3309_15875 [Sandaracinobacteroides saxicola]
MSELEPIFAALRPLFERHARSCVVTADSPTAYYLGTHEVRAKDGYRTSFGGVEIKKNYVSAHVIPVYVHPDMLAPLSAALVKRMQGKSCFNFAKVDAPLFAELGALIDAGAARFRADGRLSP